MKLFILLTICLLSSCVQKESTLANTQCCSLEARQTAKQGRQDAKKDLKNGFILIRYDLPSLRFGAWGKHYARYKHFGITERSSFSSFESMDYIRAYNNVMDAALIKRYGSEYLPYRKKLLPKKGAKRYTN